MILEDVRRFSSRSLLVRVPGHHAHAFVVVDLHHLVNVVKVQLLDALLHELNAPAAPEGEQGQGMWIAKHAYRMKRGTSENTSLTLTSPP